MLSRSSNFVSCAFEETDMGGCDCNTWLKFDTFAPAAPVTIQLSSSTLAREGLVCGCCCQINRCSIVWCGVGSCWEHGTDKSHPFTQTTHLAFGSQRIMLLIILTAASLSSTGNGIAPAYEWYSVKIAYSIVIQYYSRCAIAL